MFIILITISVVLFLLLLNERAKVEELDEMLSERTERGGNLFIENRQLAELNEIQEKLIDELNHMLHDASDGEIKDTLKTEIEDLFDLTTVSDEDRPTVSETMKILEKLFDEERPDPMVLEMNNKTFESICQVCGDDDIFLGRFSTEVVLNELIPDFMFSYQTLAEFAQRQVRLDNIMGLGKRKINDD